MNRLIARTLLTALLTASPMGHADLAIGLEAAAKQNWRTAYQEFQSSAVNGNANAEVNLGNLYMRGLGVDQSYEQARHWYEKAALQGNPIGEAKLGLLYYYGLGVEENRRLAAEWFQKAADQGDAHSAMVLGEMYSAGDGVEASRSEAYLWYSISQELGNSEADSPRNKLASELSSLEIHNALERVSHWREAYTAQVQKAGRQTTRPVKSTALTSGGEAKASSTDTTPSSAATKGQTKDQKSGRGLNLESIPAPKITNQSDKRNP